MGLREWVARRRCRAVLDNCNHEMARLLLERMFSGAVIRNKLAALLGAYTDAPGLESALSLILYDSRLIAVFELARYGGFTERIFEDRIKRGLAVDSFPSDISPDEVEDAARQLRIESYMAHERPHRGRAHGMDKEEVERVIMEPGKVTSADGTQKRAQSEPCYTEEQRDVAARLVSVASIGNIGSHEVVEKLCPEARGLLERSCAESWYPDWVYFTTIAIVGAASSAALQRARAAEERAALRYAIRDALRDWERRPWLPTTGGDKRPWPGCPGAHDYFLDYSQYMTSQPAKTPDELALAVGLWVWGNLTNATSDELKSLCPPELVVVTGRLILRLSAEAIEAALALSRPDASDA